MYSPSTDRERTEGRSRSSRLEGRKVILFIIVAAVWLIFDQMTKLHFETADGAATSAIPGLVEFRLAHNTGGAWSIFSDSTFALGTLSVIICVVVAVFFCLCMRDMGFLAVVALSLVFAGGLGNVIDRFSQGYVIDFIACTFMDFPIFNVADIGITCGIVLFAISLIADAVRESRSCPDDDGRA